MTRLSVNINKVATLRNARGGNIPDVQKFAADCEQYGAQGITVHPRPDERHIRYRDVVLLKDIVKTEFNLEGYPSPDFIKLVLSVKPDQVTLVPDPPGVLTSNAGWEIKSNLGFLTDTIAELKAMGIRTSVFMDTGLDNLSRVKETGCNRVELYTENYARHFADHREEAVFPYVEAARLLSSMDIGVNAGHDLNLQNLKYFRQVVPGLLEVSIGHALIADALYFGIENTIQMYLACLI